MPHHGDIKSDALSFKILGFLSRKDGFVSGEELSQEFSISRQAFWKHIEFLRHLGYEIEARPHYGYKITARPDKLFPFEIQRDLHTKIIGKTMHYYPVLDTTMEKMLFHAQRGAREGTVVITDAQTKGRGRLGRTWVSPKDAGIYFSVLLTPRVAPGEVSKITLLTALAIVEALEHTGDGAFSIKWPNDVFLNDRKIAGILTEIEAEQDLIKFACIGVGINVNAEKSQLPATATSLKAEFGKAMPRAELAARVLEALDEYYREVFLRGEFEKKLDDIKQHLRMLGKPVKIIQHHETIEGTAYDIDTDGALVLRTPYGVIKRILSGDVELAR